MNAWTSLRAMCVHYLVKESVHDEICGLFSHRAGRPSVLATAD
jgi:hypothetical protein